jgi:hypothetical protein
MNTRISSQHSCFRRRCSREFNQSTWRNIASQAQTLFSVHYMETSRCKKKIPELMTIRLSVSRIISKKQANEHYAQYRIIIIMINLPTEVSMPSDGNVLKTDTGRHWNGNTQQLMCVSWGSSVGIDTDYQLDGPGSIPGSARFFFSPERLVRLWIRPMLLSPHKTKITSGNYNRRKENRISVRISTPEDGQLGRNM